VLVASVRALKVHSGMYHAIAGQPLDKNLGNENLDTLRSGSVNLVKQIENAMYYGVPVVVAINRFMNDTLRELALVKEIAIESGAFGCVTSEVYRSGSVGARKLAEAVRSACKVKSKFRVLYPLDMPIKDKISEIALKIYGAKDVSYNAAASENIAIFERLGLGNLPMCMAKTHLSLSGDPKRKGAPQGFTLPVNEVKPSAGAGFLYAICGNINTMPSLPARPIGELMDIDPKGKVIHVHR
jgi:formyltetrahydrofolate synthetase